MPVVIGSNVVNKPRLIGVDKVQAWIDVEFEKKFPGDCYGYADGRQTILDKLEMKINDGEFDPDPTIKLGDSVTHKNEGWKGIVCAISQCGQGELLVQRLGKYLPRYYQMDELELITKEDKEDGR